MFHCAVPPTMTVGNDDIMPSLKEQASEISKELREKRSSAKIYHNHVKLISLEIVDTLKTSLNAFFIGAISKENLLETIFHVHDSLLILQTTYYKGRRGIINSDSDTTMMGAGANDTNDAATTKAFFSPTSSPLERPLENFTTAFYFLSLFINADEFKKAVEKCTILNIETTSSVGGGYQDITIRESFESVLLGIINVPLLLNRWITLVGCSLDLTSLYKAKHFLHTLNKQLLQFSFRNGDCRRRFDGVKYTIQKVEQTIYEISLVAPTTPSSSSSPKSRSDSPKLSQEQRELSSSMQSPAKRPKLISSEEEEEQKSIDHNNKSKMAEEVGTKIFGEDVLAFLTQSLISLKKRYEKYDSQRELTIKRSRIVQKLAKQAIFRLHEQVQRRKRRTRMPTSSRTATSDSTGTLEQPTATPTTKAPPQGCATWPLFREESNKIEDATITTAENSDDGTAARKDNDNSSSKSRAAFYRQHRDKPRYMLDQALYEAAQIYHDLDGEHAPPSLLLRGSYRNAIEELLEAIFFYEYIGEESSGTIPSMSALRALFERYNINGYQVFTLDDYVGGLVDFTGELGRYAVFKATRQDLEGVRALLHLVSCLQTNLVCFGESKKLRALETNIKKMEQIAFQLTMLKHSGKKKDGTIDYRKISVSNTNSGPAASDKQE
eukprot:g424.t1